MVLCKSLCSNALDGSVLHLENQTVPPMNVAESTLSEKIDGLSPGKEVRAPLSPSFGALIHLSIFELIQFPPLSEPFSSR